MLDELQERVIAVIADEVGVKPETIHTGTDLFAVLGVDGIDAEELMQRLSKDFGFSLEGFRFDRHFGLERPFTPLAYVNPSWWRWRIQRTSLQVRHIVEAARHHVWSLDYGRGRLSSGALLDERVREVISFYANGRMVTDDSDLWKDLGIEGDDVDMLAIDLRTEFPGLRFDGIKWGRHFEMNEPPWYFGRWGRRWKQFNAERIPVLVRDIIKWVETGVWPIQYPADRRAP